MCSDGKLTGNHNCNKICCKFISLLRKKKYFGFFLRKIIAADCRNLHLDTANIMTFKQKYTLLFILAGLSALAPFSIDMYLPAFPAIAEGLHTDIAQVTLSLTSYFIGISIGQLFYGPIIDKFGRKKPLLFGLLLFIAASIGCAFSPSIYWLITMRVVLALGGCVGMVVSRAVVRDLFPVSEIAKIFSILMLIVGVAPILAPSIGGWVVSVSDWRSIFYVLAIIGLLLTLAVYFYLPESIKERTTEPLNFNNSIRDYKAVFFEKTFLFYAFAGSAAMAGMFAYISGSPFAFMKYFGLTEAQYGWVFGINAMGFIAGSQLNRLLLKRFTSLQIVTLSGGTLLIVALSLITLLQLQLFTPVILILHLFTFLFCLGILVPNSTAMALAPFSENAGSASALIGFLQMVCGAILSAVVSALHDETLFPMVGGMATAGIVAFVIILRLNINTKKGKINPEPIPVPVATKKL